MKHLIPVFEGLPFLIDGIWITRAKVGGLDVIISLHKRPRFCIGIIGTNEPGAIDIARRTIAFWRNYQMKIAGKET